MQNILRDKKNKTTNALNRGYLPAYVPATGRDSFWCIYPRRLPPILTFIDNLETTIFMNNNEHIANIRTGHLLHAMTRSGICKQYIMAYVLK